MKRLALAFLLFAGTAHAGGICNDFTATPVSFGTSSANTTGGSLAVTIGNKIEWSIVGSTSLAANNFGMGVKGKTS